MSDFNLRALIREVADSSTIADPETLAKEVSRRIGRHQQRDALDQALVIAVRVAVSRSRGSLNPPDGHPWIESQSGSAVGGPGRSSKVTAIRAAWRRTLSERVNVGPSQWKFMSQCTVSDLEYSAAVNDQHAASNAAKATQKRRLIELLEQHGVDTVGELPDADLGDALGVAA